MVGLSCMYVKWDRWRHVGGWRWYSACRVSRCSVTWAGCCWRHCVSAGVLEACCASSLLLAWRERNRGYYAVIKNLAGCRSKVLGLRHSSIYNTDKKTAFTMLTSSKRVIVMETNHTRAKLLATLMTIKWRITSLIKQLCGKEIKKTHTILQTLNSWETFCLLWKNKQTITWHPWLTS